jgi:hypothetical protein
MQLDRNIEYKKHKMQVLKKSGMLTEFVYKNCVFGSRSTKETPLYYTKNIFQFRSFSFSIKISVRRLKL